MALATRPKPTSYHKKRVGEHHRHNKPYLKAYWPYLPMLLIVIVGLAINSIWANTGVLGASSDFSSSSLLTDTNRDRSQNHEAPLTISQQLVTAAQAKANDMARRDYWSHNTPDGKTPWSFINSAGYQYQVAGENLAYGFANASDTVAAWMNSPEHRANILNGNYQNIGFGVASSPNYQGKGPETIVVAEYGQPPTAFINNGIAGATDPSAGSVELKAQPVSRIQLLTGGHAQWSALLASALVGAACAVFIIHHGFRLKRRITQGESFIAHHPYLDIIITFIVTAGLILTHTSGLIR